MEQYFFEFFTIFLGAIFGVIAALLKPKHNVIFLVILTIGLIITGSGSFFLKYLDFGKLYNPAAEKNGIKWDAIFYDNQELSGEPTLVTKIRGAKNGLRVDWGVEAPKPNLPADYFSAVFRKEIHFSAGIYCFCIEVDDGAILYIDGQEIRNVHWGYTPMAVYKNAVTLSEGMHIIEFRYFENFEQARFHFFWYSEVVGPECVTVGHPGVP